MKDPSDVKILSCRVSIELQFCILTVKWPRQHLCGLDMVYFYYSKRKHCSVTSHKWYMITCLLITHWVGEDERKKDENPLHGVNIISGIPIYMNVLIRVWSA